MRILVAGSVPPPAKGHRASLLVEVVRLRREGHDVEVLSLDHVAAAHRYISAPGLPAALEVGLAGRHFDGVVVQLEPGLPVRSRAGRAERAGALLTLALLLRPLPQVTLRWDHPDDLPGGPGGRAGRSLWGAARQIELGPEVDSATLAELLPDGRERLSVVTAGAALTIVAPAVDWSDGAPISAAQVNEVVRRRAAATRQAIGARGRQQDTQTGERVEQWEWLPAPDLGVPNFELSRDGSSGRQAKLGSIRALAARALSVAERHGATRPAAQLARLAVSELRAAARAR
jgi:hypothetical protein